MRCFRVAEVLIYQNKHVVLYKFNSDVFYYVIAGVECNELIMEQVLSALDESLINLLRCVSSSVLGSIDYVDCNFFLNRSFVVECYQRLTVLLGLKEPLNSLLRYVSCAFGSINYVDCNIFVILYAFLWVV